MFHPVHDDKDVGAAKRRRLNLKREQGIRSNAENQAVTFMGLCSLFARKIIILIDLKKKIQKLEKNSINLELYQILR